MKKLFFLFCFSFITLLFFAQTPQAFKYQFIIRNASGDIISNQNVGLQISILQGSETGTPVYTETWNLTANQFGLININVGEGDGTDDFSVIDWGNNSYWLKISIDENGGTNYTDMGASQLLSVPYALYSNSSATGSSKWLSNGNAIYYNSGNVGIGTGSPTKKLVIKAENTTDTLLEIQDMDGNPLMVITPQLTKFNIVTGNKGVAGGFAVGRYTGAKATNEPLFSVTPDSTRVYTLTAAGVAGGFAVGRYTGAKGIASTSFYTDADSTRVYTGGPTKGVAGGFAVGRYTGAKGSSGNYMYMVPDNYFIGDSSGLEIQKGNGTGVYNTFFGFKTGLNNMSGGSNVFIGNESGLLNTSGSNNTFVGELSGRANTTGANNTYVGRGAGTLAEGGNSNTFIGNEAGVFHKSGDNNIYIGRLAGAGDLNAEDNGVDNVFVGVEAGRYNTEGDNNIFIGKSAGMNNTTGLKNIYIGFEAGKTATGNGNVMIGEGVGASLTTGSANTLYGQLAGNNLTTGNQNVLIGPNAGNNITTGSGNVCIGYKAGINETGGNKLYISNWGTATLIYGEFDPLNNNGLVRINKRLNIANEYTFPSVDGQSDQVMITNGSGILSWSDVEDLSDGDWTVSGADIYSAVSGNVGIGTTTPASKLHIKQSGTSISDGIRFQTSLTTAEDWYLYMNAGDDFIFRNDGSDYVTFQKNTGYVGIGIIAPLYKFDVNTASSTSHVARFFNDGGDNNRRGIVIQAGNDAGSTGTGNDILYIDCLDGDGSWLGSIYSSSGNLQINAKSASPGKSIGIKETDKGLNIINKLQVVDYDLNPKTNIYKTGFVGEDAIKVFPNMVSYIEDTDEYGVANSALVPVLTKAIQEQQSQIEQLQKDNEILKQQIQELKDLIQNK